MTKGKIATMKLPAKLGLFLIIIVITSLCINTYYQNINTVKILHSDAEEHFLNMALCNNSNEDGGYHDIPNVDIYESDYLYFTYYSLLCMDKLDDKYIMSNSEKLASSINGIPRKSLINPDSFDNLSNIYYYIEILKTLNGDIDSNRKKELSKYVTNLQTLEGGFGFSEIHKQKIDSGEYGVDNNKEVFLSTYMALNVLEYLKIDITDKINLEKWIDIEFDKINDKKISVENLPYILLIVKIDNLLNSSKEEHINLLSNYYKSSVDYIKDGYIRNKEVNIIFMNDILESSIVLGKASDYCREIDTIIKSFSGIQNNDGCFCIDKNESNILPTYMFLKHISLSGNTYPNKSKTIKTILKSQTQNGYFIPIVSRPSTVRASYYTYKVADNLDLISKKDIKDNIKKYLSNIQIQNIKSSHDMIFYWKLEDEIYGEASKNEFTKKYIEEIKQNLRNNSFTDISSYSQAVDSFETLDIFDETIDNQLRNDIISKVTNSKITNSNIEKQEKFLISCMEIMIFKSLKYENKDMVNSRLRIIKDVLEKSSEKIDENLRIYYLYLAFKHCGKSNLDIDYHKQIIYKELIEKKFSDSLSQNKGEYQSIEVMYIYSYILEKLSK